MRKVLILSLLLAAIVLSCTQPQKNNYAILTGTFNNGGKQNLMLQSYKLSLGIDTTEKIERQIQLNDNGFFIDTLYIDSKTTFNGRIAKQYFRFAIKPGDKVSVQADLNNYDASLMYDGDGAIINNYQKLKSQLHSNIMMEDRERGHVDEATFIKLRDEDNSRYLNILESTKGLSPEFITNEKKQIHFVKVNRYLGYARVYPFYKKEGDSELSASFLDILSTVDLNDTKEYKQSEIYPFLIRSYYNYMFASKYDVRSADGLLQLKQVNELVGNQEMKNEVFMIFAQHGFPYTEKLREYYDFFMNNVTNERYREFVTNQFNDLMATRPGQFSPEFENYRNVNGGTNSLSDFRGKYVYIDVWATWCGPCKAEIPYLIEVEKKYHDKNIEFISLSVDEQRNFGKWKKFVEDKELGGVQLIADKAFNSEFVQKYQIKGIPHFILIGLDGKIVDPNAPRPSDSKLIELFNKCGI